jgi:site-specific recombinase XerD
MDSPLPKHGFNPAAVPSTELVAPDEAARLLDIGKAVSNFVETSKSVNTRKAYRADWAEFRAWCARYRRQALPALPETVAYYLADESLRLKVSTLERRLATISQAHRAAGHESPTQHAQVRLVWSGIKREKGTAQVHMKPTLTRHLRAMVEKLPDSLVGCRDRALLLLGFAGAMRRSELVGLTVADLAFTDEGLVVIIRRSKTDQTGEGRKIGIPLGGQLETCPVRSVQRWLDESRIDEGPVFRAVSRGGLIRETALSDRVVANVVKRTLTAAGKSTKRYAGHSLRAGLITQAAMAGVSERVIQDQSGHKSLPVLRRYIRDGSLFRENAAGKVGL